MKLWYWSLIISNWLFDTSLPFFSFNLCPPAAVDCHWHTSGTTASANSYDVEISTNPRWWIWWIFGAFFFIPSCCVMMVCCISDSDSESGLKHPPPPPPPLVAQVYYPDNASYSYQTNSLPANAYIASPSPYVASPSPYVASPSSYVASPNLTVQSALLETNHYYPQPQTTLYGATTTTTATASITQSQSPSSSTTILSPSAPLLPSNLNY